MCVGQTIHVSLTSVAVLCLLIWYLQVVPVAGMVGCMSPLTHNVLRTCTTRRVRLFCPSSRGWLIQLLDWARLKGCIGLPSEIFVKLPCNVVERPLFKTLQEANYDTLFHELFAHRGDTSKDWTKQNWICVDCIREFFRMSVCRWWRQRKARGNILLLV